MNKKRKGFTLIEIILVITVLGIISFVTAPLIDAAIDSWSFVTYRSELWQKSELALLRMSIESREIRGSSDVTTATSTTFRFTTVAGDDVTYSLTGNTLYRNGDVLLSDIQVFTFTYYDKDMNNLATPTVSPMVTDIRVVRFYVELGPTGRTFTTQTDVHPRNLD